MEVYKTIECKNNLKLCMDEKFDVKRHDELRIDMNKNID